MDRGSYSTLTCHPGKKLENNYSLNTVDICPVGALTSTDFRFKMRVWFLKQTNTIDIESSVGVNAMIWSREGVIYRLTPRRNDAVNDTWMSDSGRLTYKQVAAPDRLTALTVNGAVSALDLAINAAAELFNAAPGSVAIVGSGRASVEEQFLLKQLAAQLGATATLVARTGAGDGLLISADRNPNVRGALVTGLVSELPSAQLTSLAADIDAGKVKTLVVHNEDLTTAGLSAAQLAKVTIIYLGTHAHATSAAAKIVIPTLHTYEKAGTFVNQQFRIQKFAAAVPGPQGANNDLVVLAKLVVAAGGSALASDVHGLWPTIAASVPALASVLYKNIPDTGLLLDATTWANLPFVEGESLHYKPATAAVAAA